MSDLDDIAGVVTASVQLLDAEMGKGLDPQLEDNARLLYALRSARQHLHALEQAVENLITAAFRTAGIRDPLTVDGVGVVEVRRGNVRKAWDHERLAAVVIDTHLRETGEVPDPFLVRDWLLEACAPSYWRATKLKELGIPVDEYCQTSPGRATVQIT